MADTFTITLWPRLGISVHRYFHADGRCYMRKVFFID